jgi:hypothetical protein
MVGKTSRSSQIQIRREADNHAACRVCLDHRYAQDAKAEIWDELELIPTNDLEGPAPFVSLHFLLHPAPFMLHVASSCAQF